MEEQDTGKASSLRGSLVWLGLDAGATVRGNNTALSANGNKTAFPEDKWPGSQSAASLN